MSIPNGMIATFRLVNHSRSANCSLTQITRWAECGDLRHPVTEEAPQSVVAIRVDIASSQAHYQRQRCRETQRKAVAVPY